MRTRRLCAVLTALLLGTSLALLGPTRPADAYPTPTVSVTGHGFGHGRGLGQWGAYGYATSGLWFWTYDQILSHYYSNATLASQADGPITVRLMGQEGLGLVVTSAGGMSVGSGPSTVWIAPNAAVRLQPSPSGGWDLFTGWGCSTPDWGGNVTDATVAPAVADPGNDLTKMLTLCQASSSTQYRGALRLVEDATGLHTVNVVDMEDYLRGVVPRESPASWGDVSNGHGMHALYAQAVAARSYAWAENRTAYAKTCDTTSCQVYGGAGINYTRIEDSRTDTAVGNTAQQVMRMNVDNSIARTEFSSSTGGYTAGGTFPAVPDDGDIASPYHNWSTSLPVANIEAAYGVGTLTGIAVTSRNGLGEDGGRALTVAISGTTKTTSISGTTFQSQWGLRSNWLSFPAATAPLSWYVRNTADPGPATSSYVFGSPGDIPIACDWFHQGFDTPGVFRAGQWFLSKSADGSTVDAVFRYGDAGDTPLCGDWDGDGFDTVGIWRSGVFMLNNQNDGSAPDGVFGFGNPTDRPLAGNWNGDPWDSVGVDRNGVFYLADSNLAPTADHVFAYGNPDDIPVVGDWNGDGVDTVGVRRSYTFYLSDDPASGVANRVVPFGNPTDRPVTGAWAGGATGVGVTR